MTALTSSDASPVYCCRLVSDFGAEAVRLPTAPLPGCLCRSMRAIWTSDDIRTLWRFRSSNWLCHMLGQKLGDSTDSTSLALEPLRLTSQCITILQYLVDRLGRVQIDIASRLAFESQVFFLLFKLRIQGWAHTLESCTLLAVLQQCDRCYIEISIALYKWCGTVTGRLWRCETDPKSQPLRALAQKHLHPRSIEKTRKTEEEVGIEMSSSSADLPADAQTSSGKEQPKKTKSIQVCLEYVHFLLIILLFPHVSFRSEAGRPKLVL